MLIVSLLLLFLLSIHIPMELGHLLCNGNSEQMVFSCLFPIFIFCAFCCVFWACSVNVMTATGEVCDCSGNVCTDAEFCYDGVCNANSKSNFSVHYFTFCFFFLNVFWVCSVGIGMVIGEDCDCFGNTCTYEFCYDRVCNTNAKSNYNIKNSIFFSSICFLFLCLFWACQTVSNIMATGEACDCSGNMCTDAEFCYDGSCNTNAKSNFLSSTSIWHFFCPNVFWVCSVSTTMVTGEACDCSENTCADNEFCYDGVCNTNPGIFMFIPNVYFLFLLLCALSLFCQQYHGYWRNL